jgi:Ca-activated chloride channel family protein
MRRLLSALALTLSAVGSAQAHGILIPVEKKLPPLAMLNHHVNISIDDQVAITKVEQTFRNHTDRQLEATYIFPVPKGASVRKFSMWVDGKEVPGELVEADKARKIYTDIVQRTLDPGLLEYLGNNLFQLKVFPVPPKGDQKIAISYTSVAGSEKGLIDYVYPLKTDGKATGTLEKFSIKVDLKSQHPITNIYSPTHAITMTRPSDRQAIVGFEKEQALLDRDFQLYYTTSAKDVGLTAMTHRPIADKNGFFMMLASPRVELSKSQQVPRDMVFVLDTSGSMRGKRMTQARSALQYCLNNLAPNDRFTLINFATTVNRYNDQLLTATQDQVQHARKWVDGLEATGGTAINDALAAALDMQSGDTTRTFTVVFFTDGRPTIGETNADKILKNVTVKNTASTRIFTFGVGDDVNASMLDRLAEQTRAVSTYVRESEDIESRVASLYGKISNPVLTNLKMTVSGGISLAEVYPPQLPDLFHGSQLVVLGRYAGSGHAAIKLTGSVGKDTKEFIYEITFADKTGDDRNFVEDLWARRKVGYLLDQIRANGEKKELVEEVVTLAKRYGITTPYTSYLVVPDAPVPVAGFGNRMPGKVSPPPIVLAPRGGAGGPALPLEEFIKGIPGKDGLADARDKAEAKKGKAATEAGGLSAGEKKALASAERQKEVLEQARRFLLTDLDRVQAGQLAVDLSVQSNSLREQTRLTQTATRTVAKRQCIEIGGVWIDDALDPKMKTVSVKAMSAAYFRMLERHPQLRDVFRLGNFVVWVTPSNTALVIDQNAGQEEMSDPDIDRLFVAAGPKK